MENGSIRKKGLDIITKTGVMKDGKEERIKQKFKDINVEISDEDLLEIGRDIANMKENELVELNKYTASLLTD